ncbi:ABC-type multidrug transport system, ATPase component [Paucidesulfovibrio gracilis DSM 16080]|uniref:ABC-type multidrug transport system, ATPase component n=1 Tax=Paucidesulfovibrio gracilis DSM 16080 TaxID=1121449 RepID=A0A1T4WZF9_9BACT|nr:ATP-binding cassette domain-containing protein [Paucidesulfovibrio gracilis]SKA82258.1 ABC-type multidrug transport system, ATPase component [Paucidesulfovibrio gracilis DSM 16080]
MLRPVTLRRSHRQRTQEHFEDSLAAQVLKLLALVAQAGPEVSARRRSFIDSFYGHLYPSDVVRHFREQFESFLSRSLDLGAVCRALDERLSYQEKVYCLIIVYEFIIADKAESVERRLARAMSKLLRISEWDVRFVESHFGLAEPDPEALHRSGIIALRVTGDLETADVYLPFPGLDVLIYKIRNLYCITKKCDGHEVVVDNYELHKNISTRVSHNYRILFDDYSLKHHDLKAYFENKVNPLNVDRWVTQDDLEPAYADAPGENDVLRLEFRGARIRLVLMDPYAVVNVNDQLVQDAVQVNLDDDIFVNGFRMNLRELFYSLNARRDLALDDGREEYRLTNSVRGDLFIHDDLSERWTSVFRMDRARRRLRFDPRDCPYQIYLNNRPCQGQVDLRHGDTLFVHGNYLTLDTEQEQLRKAAFSFNKFSADRIHHVFEDGTVGLDEVSLDIEYGELVAIMGPSGSGKSTLLRVMSGFETPTSGQVRIDEYDLHSEYGMLKHHLGYVPQEDLLLSNLTVYENLYYYAKLRFPDKSEEELDAKIQMVLTDISLTERRDLRVGDVTDKTLSGGERKRLNIGLELLTDADIYMLDEPTSGLSSKDSEKIVELLANITLRGKIVVCVIHQPSSRIYKNFNKVVLLDHGGKLAYYGTTYAALEYFKRHMERDARKGRIVVECPRCKTVQPGILLDSLEESLRDIDGSVLGKRKYSPDYWKQEYESTAIDAWLSSIQLPSSDILPPKPAIGLRERLVQFQTLLSRNYRSKVRDRSNLLITFLEAPLLGAGVGFILRYTPAGDYSLYTNDLFGIFLFVAVIVTLFLSMTNSVDEIIGDSSLFMRERMLDMTSRTYLGAKLLVLLPFAVVQNALFVALGFYILEVHELTLAYILYLSLLSYAGLSAGLFISSLPRLSSRAAQNIVPLMLVPQIILGGALIEYEKMNKSLTIVENSPIPEICQLMPSRWAYEGLMVLQENNNSYHARHQELSDQLRELKINLRNAEGTPEQAVLEPRKDRLEDALESFRASHKYRYGNKNIHDAVTLGEKRFEEIVREHMDMDPQRAETGVEGAMRDWNLPYPMFVPWKILPLVNVKGSTTLYNALVLLAMGLIMNVLTLAALNWREQMLRMGRRAKSVAKKVRPQQLKL